jgi:MerR family copper efflux transcriptional regulator
LSETDIEQANLTIGQLAARFALAPHVLRHWEAMGLIAPAERPSGRRRYREGQVARVALIVRGKEAGFSLKQIGEVLNASDGPSRKELIRRHHVELEERIARIETSKSMLECALECSEEDFLQCQHFQSVLQQLSTGSRPNGRASAHDCAGSSR